MHCPSLYRDEAGREHILKVEVPEQVIVLPLPVKKYILIVFY